MYVYKYTCTWACISVVHCTCVHAFGYALHLCVHMCTVHCMGIDVCIHVHVCAFLSCVMLDTCSFVCCVQHTHLYWFECVSCMPECCVHALCVLCACSVCSVYMLECCVYAVCRVCMPECCVHALCVLVDTCADFCGPLLQAQCLTCSGFPVLSILGWDKGGSGEEKGNYAQWADSKLNIFMESHGAGEGPMLPGARFEPGLKIRSPAIGSRRMGTARASVATGFSGKKSF